MAKVDDNLMVEALRGKIGNLVFRRMPNGETWVSRNYNFSNRKFSKPQRNHQSRFQKAAAYAKSAARRYPIYARLAQGTVKSPYNWALSDWFKPPVVQRIERTAGHIRILAVDNVQVTRVQVTILDKAGRAIEKGNGTKAKGNWWEYASTTPGRVVAEAWDLAGNVGRGET